MTDSAAPKDLVALVADKDCELALCGLLSRHASLGISPLIFDVFVHPGHDPGCVRGAVDFLRSLAWMYRHSLVIFDLHGSGREHQCSREELEHELEQHLGNSGWNERTAVIVIQPELEAWVWSDSPHVDQALGWSRQDRSLRDWLSAEAELDPITRKPVMPKRRC